MAGINEIPISNEFYDYLTKRLIEKANIKPSDKKKKQYYDLVMQIITSIIAGAGAAVVAAGTVAALSSLDISSQMETLIAGIIADNTSDITDAINSFYDEGKDAAFNEMNVEPYTSDIDEVASNDLVVYNVDLVTNASDDLKDAIQDQIQQGLDNGETINAIAERLNDLPLEPVQAGERMISPEDRAQMIARTESMRAINQASMVSYQQYGVEWVNIVGGADPCDECQEYQDNSPYKMDDPDLPVIPAHPNCEDGYSPADDPDSSASDVSISGLVSLIPDEE